MHAFAAPSSPAGQILLVSPEALLSPARGAAAAVAPSSATGVTGLAASAASGRVGLGASVAQARLAFGAGRRGLAAAAQAGTAAASGTAGGASGSGVADGRAAAGALGGGSASRRLAAVPVRFSGLLEYTRCFQLSGAARPPPLPAAPCPRLARTPHALT